MRYTLLLLLYGERANHNDDGIDQNIIFFNLENASRPTPLLLECIDDRSKGQVKTHLYCSSLIFGSLPTEKYTGKIR